MRLDRNTWATALYGNPFEQDAVIGKILASQPVEPL
jgi:hypothetical protein